MKILVKDFLRKPVLIDETVEAGSIGLDEKDLGLTCKSPIHIKAKIERVGEDTALAAGNITGRFSIVCGRCLDEVENDFHKRFSVDSQISEEDDAFDLGDEIRQEIITSFANIFSCEHFFKGADKDKAYQACIAKQDKNKGVEVKVKKPV